MVTSGSSNRKGVTTWKETKLGIIPRSQLVRLEAEGTAKGLAFILKAATLPKLVITERLICDLHKRCFRRIFSWAGMYRSIQVEVSQHQPPKPHEIRMHMKNFTEDLRARLQEIAQSKTNQENTIQAVIDTVVWSQHRFLWIHPFQDYNGRIARLLSNLILAHFRLPLIQIDFRDRTIRTRYITALQKADTYDYSNLTRVITEMLGVKTPSTTSSQYNDEFIQGIKGSLEDVKKGSVKKIQSLKELQ